jgi:hypothetical protein
VRHLLEDAKMSVEYRINLREQGWMIERQGQLYGPYSSQQEAVREAIYVANYSINHGLQAQVIGPKYPLMNRLIPALRTIIHQHIAP